MKIFYRPEQSVWHKTGYSPSPRKPAALIDYWIGRGEDLDVVSFEPVTRADLYQVHDKSYVDGILDCQQLNGFGSTDASVARCLPFVAGSMVAATLHAYNASETTFSLTSGAHHAGYNYGSGFCTFNFLALAALEVYKSGAQRVAIVDCDRHHGDGTVDIVNKLDLGFIQHYSFNHDRTFHKSASVEEWLRYFQYNMRDIARNNDIIIYNAGVDAHVHDPLGGLLTTKQLQARDIALFGEAAREKTPVVVSLAGGYQTPLRKVLKLHDNTYQIACSYERQEKEAVCY